MGLSTNLILTFVRSHTSPNVLHFCVPPSLNYLRFYFSLYRYRYGEHLCASTVVTDHFFEVEFWERNCRVVRYKYL